MIKGSGVGIRLLLSGKGGGDKVTFSRVRGGFNYYIEVFLYLS